VNEAFCAAFKYSEEQILGKNFRVLLPADTPQEVSERLFDRRNSESWNGDVRCVTKQGHIFYMALSISVITDEKGQPIAFAGVSRDLTEERTIQENMRKAEMLNTIQELAGSVSHEFSQPLQALNNYISLLKMGRIKKEYLINSELAVKRITELVDNLGEITSIQKQDYLNSKIIDLKASALNKQKLAHKRILVVDDEQHILETVIEMLRISGYECEGAADGLEALQKISKQQYQLVISDINMPRMSGIRLFEKLQAIGYKGAFVFLTGYSVPNEISYFINDIDGLLNKPVDMHKLTGIVKKLLGTGKEET
jgi:PAS domain S-box-containing protein